MRDRLGAVQAVARDAGALALSRWRGHFDHWDKAPGEVVSDVDLAVNALLRERLHAIDPDAGWLSEETADSAERLLGARCWVVDPIDGTRDFVRGRRGWCVSVALVEAGRVQLAVLDAPAREQHWAAAAGLGAWRNDLAVHAAERTTLSGARVPAEALPDADNDLVRIERPNSIALRIAMVASGEADLVASLRWGNEWDIAAAVLIAQEAGAIVTDALGAPLRFNSTSGEMFGVLATAPGIHAAAVDRLAARAAVAVVRQAH